MRARMFGALLVCAVLSVNAAAAQTTMSYKAMGSTKFGPHPALPACATIAVQDGDPATGPSVIALRASKGCVIPWHWHSAGERLILVRGAANLEMKDSPSVTLHPGDFALMPARHIHRLKVLASLELYDIPEAAFDIHYVDADGKEIPPADALKH